jgi:hypothetical protein
MVSYRRSRGCGTPARDREDETLVGQIVGATKDRRLEKIRGQGESCVPHDLDGYA